MHPAAGRDVFERIADGHVVAAHHASFGNVYQRHLVALGHLVAQCDACAGHMGGQHRASRQAPVVGNDGNVVLGVHADGEGESRQVVHFNNSTSGFCTTCLGLAERTHPPDFSTRSGSHIENWGT